MKNKKMIVQISEGLGNQLFMYAHGYALSKNSGFELFVDNISGYKYKKNLLRKHQIYRLNYFDIDTPLIKDDFLINSRFYSIFKKFFLIYDFFKFKKSFYIENKFKLNNNKKVVDRTTKINFDKLSDKVYVLGNFENPEYFNEFKSELIKKFKVKKNYLNLYNPVISDLQNNNSVSIHLRRDKYTDQFGISGNDYLNKSDKFTDKSIDYINNGIKFFYKNVYRPKFFIWSNNVDGIENFTKKLNISDYVIVKDNDTINDFNLFSFSKHFIVSPSTFHWWGAWLNQYNGKICVRPSNINPSNNVNFWPSEWISI